MRIQSHSSAATATPAAAPKSGRTAHASAMKPSTSVPAAAPAKQATTPARTSAVPAAAEPKVASHAQAAEAAAKPETYGGAGSLLDAHA